MNARVTGCTGKTSGRRELHRSLAVERVKTSAPRWRRHRRRLESFLAVRGYVRRRPRKTPNGLDTLLASRNHPKTSAGMGGRAGAGFLPGIQKPAPARLIRPARLYGRNRFSDSDAGKTLPATCAVLLKGG
jgi:hypothetical protein